MTARVVTLEPYMRDTPPGAFRALLWKEFRELVRPGLAALAIVGLGLLFSSSIDRSYVSIGISAEISGGTPSLFTLTSGVAALLIGWSQIRRENRGDAWALLVHRPVRRSTIFWSKVIAGGVIYLLAAGIPMLLTAAWQAAPGNRPIPFDARLMLPNVADLMCGLVYYAAAVLSTMREARWYASRALPIGAAMVCSTFVIVTPSFAVALLVSAAGILVVGTAARATFIAGGFYTPQAVPARVLLGVSVSLGLFIAGSIAIGLLTAFLVVGQPRPLAMSRGTVASDGSIVRVVSSFSPFGNHSEQVTDLSGRPLQVTTSNVFATPDVTLDSPVRRPGYRSSATVFVPVASSPGQENSTSWYYLRREHLIEIYDNLTSRPIGWMGPRGYSPSTSPPMDRFVGGVRPLYAFGYGQSLIAFPRAVYRLDRDRRAIQRIFTPAAGEEVVGAAEAGAGAENGLVRPEWVSPSARFVAIVTTHRMHVQAADGATELDVPPDPLAAGYGTVRVLRAVTAPAKPIFLWYSANNGTLPDAVRDTAKDQITKYDSTGVVLAHVAVRAFSTLGPPARTQWAVIVTRHFLEPIIAPVWTSIRTSSWGDSSVSGNGHAATVAVWISNLLGAVVFAIIAFVVARRYAFPSSRQWWWTVIAFLGGALGLLLMLSLIEWPARVPCPSCGRERVVTREWCEHCGAPFPAPARDGTEIFELAPV